MRTPLELAEASLEATRNRDRDGWLALFEPDAVVEDRVGPSPTDPEGLGHQGIERITAFSRQGDLPSGKARLRDRTVLYLRRRGGDRGELPVSGAAGGSMDMDLINIYKRSPNGKLQSLRSFWDGSRQRPE